MGTIVPSFTPLSAHQLQELRWPGFKLLGTVREKGQTALYLTARAGSRAKCPHCGSLCWKIHSQQLRRAYDVSFNGIGRQLLILKIPRFRCACGHTFSLCPSFIDPRSRLTNALILFVQHLMRLPALTLSAVSELTHLSIPVLRKHDKTQLEHCFKDVSLSGVSCLAIDEFAIRKGHKYATAVIDNDTARVLWVGRGKSAVCVQPFFDLLKEKGVAAQIRCVACDQNAAFPKLVRENLPNAKIVYDLFHVMAHWREDVLAEGKKVTRERAGQRLLSEALDQARQQTLSRGNPPGDPVADMKAVKSQVRKTLSRMTGIDWLMVTPSENLSESRKQRLLEVLTQDNALLSALYPVTESIRRLWTVKGRENAGAALENLCRLLLQISQTHCFKPAKQFAAMLRRRADGIISAGDFGYTTNRLEGANNKIKTLKRAVYGFGDDQYYFLKIKSILPGKGRPSPFRQIAGYAVIGSRLWRPDSFAPHCCFHAQL